MFSSKEAEMRAIKLAGTMLLVLGTVAMAGTNGTVAWDLYTTNNTTIALGATTSITWKAAVTAAGNNQGLASFLFDLSVWNPANTDTVKVPAVAATWSPAYSVVTPDPNSPGTRLGTNKTLITAGDSGGPGMDTLASAGTPNPAEWFIAGIGSSYTLGWAAGQSGPLRWDADNEMVTGKVVWGVGLASRTGQLLNSGKTVFDIIQGKINITPAWAAGTYTVKLVPQGTLVLLAGLDLNTFQDGSVSAELAAADVAGDTLTFVITPEPTSMLLLAAGATMLYRRRRSA